MSYIGKTPTPAPLTANDITDGIISTNKLADTSVTNAKLNADLISGETELATSPADTDEFLISDAGVLKRLDASLVGGGLVLQVVSVGYATAVTQTSNAYATSGLTASITPASTSNKVLVLTSSAIQTFGDGSSSSGRTALVGLFRGTVSATKLVEHDSGISMVVGSTSTNDHSYNTVSFSYLDTPSTTSAQVYTVGISGQGASEIRAQGGSQGSIITLIEIAG